jgi:hypothetical protein
VARRSLTGLIAALLVLPVWLATRGGEAQNLPTWVGGRLPALRVLIGVIERPGPDLLVKLDRRTLRPRSRPLVTLPAVGDFAFSPDGTRVALGATGRRRIQLVDVRRWRSLGSFKLPGPKPAGYGGTGEIAWPTTGRLLVLSGPPDILESPVLVDPDRRRVLWQEERRLRVLRAEATRSGLVLLTMPRGIGAARLVIVDLRGRVREVELRRIEAGYGVGRGGGERYRWPGLALDRERGRAYVVAAGSELVAEVDLRTWRAAYHALSRQVSLWRRLADLIEPPAEAKAGPTEGSSREARWLPNGAIAVTGDDHPPGPPGNEYSRPYGLRLIDTRDWTVRTVDRRPQTLAAAGDLLLAARWPGPGLGPPLRGLLAYDFGGRLRFRRFADAKVSVLGGQGRYGYVEVRRAGRRSIHVIGPRSGRSVRVLSGVRLRLLVTR